MFEILFKGARGCMVVRKQRGRTTSFVALIPLLGLLLAACTGAPVVDPNESLGTTRSALDRLNSLTLESTENIADTGGAVITGLDDQLGSASQGGYFAVARYNGARTSLGVQLWELKDRDSQPGAMYLMQELTAAASSLTKIRIAALGPTVSSGSGVNDYHFIVATRESGQLKLRTYFSGVNTLELKSTLTPGETITALAITPIFQSRDVASPLQFATATTNSAGQLKVITWIVNETTGAITRKSTITADTVSGVALAAPKSPGGIFTTASILASNQDLKMTAWSVAADGTLTQGGSYVEAGDLTQVSATSAGYRRTAVAFNDRGGAGCRVATFEVDAARNVTEVDESDLGSASDDPRQVVVTSGGAGRAFVVGDTSTNTTTVRSWSIAGSLFQIDSTFGFSSRQVTGATVLKGDRLVVTTLTSTGGLEVESWRDYYSPLARGEWAPTNNNIVPQDRLQEVPFFPSNPSSGSPERLIASSPRFVVSCGTATCSFSDKAGNQLTTANISTIIGGLVDPLNHNLEAQYPCDPELPSGDSRCVLANSTYDSRVLYSQEVGRFVIVTALRHDSGDNYGRYLAWAVSKTEDPRDGFYTFADQESIRRDDLKASVAGGVLLIGHDGLSDSPPDDTTSGSWKPAALVIDLNALASNASFINNTKLTSQQAGSGNTHMPVHFSQPRVVAGTPVQSDLSVFMKPGNLTLYAFWKDVEGPVSVYSTPYPLANSLSGNNSDYEAVFSKEVLTGVFQGEFVRIGHVQSLTRLILQDVKFTAQRGVGFTSVTGQQRELTCSGCDRPTPAVYDGKILIAYLQRHASNSGFDAKYMYLQSETAAPIVGLVKQGDSADASMPQNYLISPDGGNSASTFNGFWLTQSYSSGGSPAPVEMRVLPH